MSEAREAVLARIRTALADGAAVPEVPRDYRDAGTNASDEVVARFVAQVEELGGAVVPGGDARAAIAETLAAEGASRVVVARDLPDVLRPDGVELVEDDGLSPWELDALDGALTTCAVACADTGTVALDGGPGQGRRAMTAAIVRQIEQASGRTVEATRAVDPDLIGGLILQAGSLRVDASVRGRLDRLRRELVTRT